MLIDVKDDVLINDSGGQPWEDDAIEVFVDGNNGKTASYDSNDHRYIFTWYNDTVFAFQDSARTVNPAGVTFARDTTSAGYVMEIKIDWDAVGVSPSGGHLIGFDIHVNDDDTGGSRDKKISWKSTTEQSGKNPSGFGTVILYDYVCGASKITAHPENIMTCVHSNAVLAIQAINVGTYQWQVNQGTGFTALSDNATYSGTHTDTLHITNAPGNISGYQYRCIASNTLGSDTSYAAVITIEDREKPVIVSSPGNQTSITDSSCHIILPDYTGHVIASDNCYWLEELIITQTPEPYTIVSDTTIEVILTVSDPKGNSSQVSFDVYLADDIQPAIACPADQNIVIPQGQTVYRVSDTAFDPSVNDNCTVARVTNDYNNLSTLAGADFPPDTTTVVWTVADKAGNEAHCSFDVIVVDQNTGMESLQQHEILVYPNPAAGILHYDANHHDIQKLSLSDLTGKLIIERLILDDKGTIDVSRLNPGIYMLNLTMEKGIWRTRLIKK